MQNGGLVTKYKELWVEIFGDNLAFVDKYFSKFLNDDTFCHITDTETTDQSNQELISALIACKYKWFWQEELFDFAYLSGILTDKNHRKQGYCSQLITNSLNKLSKNDTLLCGLIAADENLIEYYKKFGFVQINPTKEVIFNRRNINKSLIDSYFLLKDIDLTDHRYIRFFSRRDNAVSHSIETLALYDNNYLKYAVMYQGSLRSVAIGRKTKDFIELIDINYTDSQALEAILSLIAFTYKKDVKILKHQNGMLRILNAHKLLEIYASKHYNEDFSLHITDEIITQNNITVRICNSTVQNIKNSYAIPHLTIEELTLKLFSDGKMFLMLDI
ncbi:MAG: GNAT family N-acetyltransferase [Bacteroidales bacterium]|nr:GNAT family N-acetyltransferase [Bacteroidales bacterium]